MTINFIHIGISVRDLNASVNFYTEVLGMDKNLSSIVLAVILGGLTGLLYGEIVNLVDYGPWPKIGGIFVTLVFVIILIISNEEKA